MENNAKKIIDNYKAEIKKIDGKYDIKKLEKDKKELDGKIDYEKKFIERLEEEGRFVNEEMINKAKARLEKAKKDKEDVEESLQDASKIKKMMVKLPSGREVTMEEKDKIDKEEAKNRAIRALTKESNKISEELMKKSQELEAKRKEWNEFKYEFEIVKDSKGNDVRKTKNDDVVKKIHEDYDKIKKEMTELNKMQEECDKYKKELNGPSFEEIQEEARKEAEKARKEVEKAKKRTDEKEDEDEKDKPDEKDIIKSAANKEGGMGPLKYKIDGAEAGFYDNSSYKELLKNIEENGYMGIEFEKEELKKVDPFLLDYLEKNNSELGKKVAEKIKAGEDLSEFKELIQYDMKDANQLSRKNKKLCKAIAKIAEANGLEVKNIEQTRGKFRNLMSRIANSKIGQIVGDRIKAIGAGEDPELLDEGKGEEENPEEENATEEQAAEEKTKKKPNKFKEEMHVENKETIEKNIEKLEEYIDELTNMIAPLLEKGNYAAARPYSDEIEKANKQIEELKKQLPPETNEPEPTQEEIEQEEPEQSDDGMEH